ncbi:MAG: translation initiation factor IF-2 [Firmicutes bacterium]|nr:translation initiation factor IF-2 [Bacillota bacterium]
MRVYELAKELGITSKELLSLLRKIGVEAANHMSVLEEKTIKRAKEKAKTVEKGETKAAVKPRVFKTAVKEEKRVLPALDVLEKKIVPRKITIIRPPKEEAPSKKEVKEKAEEAVIPEKKAVEVKEVKKAPGKSAVAEKPPVKVPAVEKAPSKAPVDEKPLAKAPVAEKPPVKAVKPALKTVAPVKEPPHAVEKPPVQPKMEAPKAAVPPAPKAVSVPVRPTLPPRAVAPPARYVAQPVAARHVPVAKPAPPPVAVELKKISLPDLISIADLATRLEVSANEIIKLLMKQGYMITINQNLNFDKAAQVARNFGFEAEVLPPPEEVFIEEEDTSKLSTRPPVVTVLGHVDHGKTSLLDAIRKTNVTAGEAGGITQKIGAYMVDLQGRKIVFIDTPGHEAFTAMRARGAKVTDVAVLVVAADDGVMPQTIEAINHAKAAMVPIIVAINKVDKPQANPERIKQQLADLDLLAEDWGGETVCIPVSAKQKIGIPELLEMILLVSDIQELKANPNRRATGTIIEARLDRGLGPVATVLVQNGTLKMGDPVVVGLTYGKVKVMINDKGERIKKAFPSTPVEIIGLSGVAQAGDILQVLEDERMAKQITEARNFRKREEKVKDLQKMGLEDFFNQLKESESSRDLNIIVKTDGQGAVEALRHALSRLSTENVKVNVIHGGVGTVTESDILLATASNAIIIGFNIRPDPNVKKLAEQESVDIRLYRVIYHVIEDIKAAMTGMLKPEFEEILTGRAEVRQIFKMSKVGVISGAYVTDGKITRNADVRILRDGVVIYEGKIDSLRRFKEDVREASAGFECGIGIEKYGGLQVGDIIEAYQLQEIKRETSVTG